MVLACALLGCGDDDYQNLTTYGAQWPTLMWVLEASASMNDPVPGPNKVTALSMLKQVMSDYSKYTFPVRNGAVTYNDHWRKAIYAPNTNINNLSPFEYALNHTLARLTNNTTGGLKRARTLMGSDMGSAGRHMVLVSTSIPNAGPGCTCTSDTTCCVSAALAQATEVRNNDKVALHTVEIRRANSSPAVTKFLVQVAGKPGSSGNDSSMFHVVQSNADAEAFINALTRHTCAFGPLPSDAGVPPRKVIVSLRDKNGMESPILRVHDRDRTPSVSGYEYKVTGKEGHVILSMKACSDLGFSNQRHLVVRW